MEDISKALVSAHASGHDFTLPAVDDGRAPATLDDLNERLLWLDRRQRELFALVLEIRDLLQEPEA